LRRRGLRRAAEWMRQRLEGSDGLGAIFPPMIYTVIALRCLGVADDDPEMRLARQQLADLIIEENDTVRLQPCFSPVWDTALTLIGLADAMQHTRPNREARRETRVAVNQGIDWLLAKEVRQPGDWSLLNKGLEPGGW